MPHPKTGPSGRIRALLGVPLFLALGLLVLQLLTAGRYGIFCDEMYYVAVSKRLAWGAVDHPPLVDAVTWLSRLLFGDALLGLRLWPALAGAMTVMLTADLARRLGGRHLAQGLAALAILAGPAFLALFGTLSMNAFDILLCTLALQILVRILNRPSPRLWLAFGLVAGIGLENKYTMGVLGLGALAGLLATPARRELRRPWPYLAALIAGLIFLPHVLWQARHDWPVLEFMANAQRYKNQPLSPLGFFGQLALGLNPLTLLLWAPGLIALFARRWRPLGILVAVGLLTYLLGRSKFYYVMPFFPLLLAAGAAWWERRLAGWRPRWPKPALLGAIALTGALLVPYGVPLLSVKAFIRYGDALGLTRHLKLERADRVDLPLHFAYRFGWEEMVDQVAGAYHALPAEDRARCTILASSYNKAAAIDYFGPARGLPPALATQNQYGLWGPGQQSGEVSLCVGFREEVLAKYFAVVERVAAVEHPYAHPNETGYPICVCREPFHSFQVIWPRIRVFI
ncbi:MAG: glycosyltransferase family 39 protein [Candidatus Krumholzibacteriota bacterium]|nr:glycosyltransferase family 39 protein [Candidatus Krumholzibacteriota bacterium]